MPLPPMPPPPPKPPNPPTPKQPNNQRRHNVSLLAYSPLAGGALTGKYLSGDAPATARFNLFTGAAPRLTGFDRV
jgi:hypothetical protein